MALLPFPHDPQLTGLVLAYKNQEADLIADQIAPRVPVAAMTFEYDWLDTLDPFTLPDDRVGRLSKPNQVTTTATRRTGACTEYALDYPVPQSDIANAGPGYDPRAIGATLITDYLLLNREKRVADIVFNLNTYLPALRTTLSGTNQWSDYTNAKPYDAIMNALDNEALMIRPNAMIVGQTAWSKMRRNPNLIEACLGTSEARGAVSREAVRDALELKYLFVGASRLNTAKPGQAADLARTWGKHCALVYLNPSIQLTPGTQEPTFMLTAQFGQRIAGSIPDPDVGMRGGERVRVGEAVGEIVISNQLGYFFQNCVA